MKNKDNEISFLNSEEHVKLFYALQKKSDKMNERKKKGITILICLIIFYCAISLLFGKYFTIDDIHDVKFNENMNIKKLFFEENDFIENITLNLDYLALFGMFTIFYIIYSWITKLIKFQNMKYLSVNAHEFNNEKFEKEMFDESFDKKKYIIKEKKSIVNWISPDLYITQELKKYLISFAHQNRKLAVQKIDGWYSYVEYFSEECKKYKRAKVPVQFLGLVKIRRKFFIELNNWRNLLISIWLLCGVLVFNLIDRLDLLSKVKLQGIAEWKYIALSILLSFLFVRIISRSIEIVLAFYKDVVQVNSKLFYQKIEGEEQKKEYINKFDQSLLRKGARLSLAIHTLVEIILTFAVVYWLVLLLFSDVPEQVTVIETLLFSFSISAFNFSFTTYSLMLLSFLHVTQVLLSVVLILISIAQYIGEEKLTEDEKNLYANYKLIELEQTQKCWVQKGEKAIEEIDDQIKILENQKIEMEEKIERCKVEG